MDWKELISLAKDLLTTAGIRLVGALVVWFIGSKLLKFCVKWLKTSPKMDRVDASLRSFLVSFAKVVFCVVLVITIASILGVPATSFITILASCGVAIGLALQGSLSNFAGGLMILFFKPFRVGDFIESAGVSGTVTGISVVYTQLLTPDNKCITMPNGALTNAVIINYSTQENRRVDLTFTASYKDDVEKVKQVIRQVVEANPYTLQDPAPVVVLSAHADNALTYTVRIWCKSQHYWDLYFDVMQGVKTAFDQNGISIPYPQMDVHINNP